MARAEAARTASNVQRLAQEQAIKLDGLRADIELAGVVSDERRAELQFARDLHEVERLRLAGLTEEAALMERLAAARRDEALRQASTKRIAEQARQDELAGTFSGFEDAERLVPKINEQLDEMANKWGIISEAVSNAFGAIGQAVGGMAGRVVAWLGQMITSAIQLAVSLAAASVAWTSPLGMLAIAGFVAGGLMALVSSVSARADGGPITGFRPYLVGERGPELIVPNSSGTVIPNHQLGGGTVNVTFNAPVDQAWWRSNERHIVRTLREAARSGRA